MTFSRIHHVTGAEERERRHGEGEKGVPGGHALSLYNIVSFEKFPPRKDTRNLGEPLTVSLKRLTLFPLPEIRISTAGFASVTRRATLCISKKYVFWRSTQRITHSSLLILGVCRNPLCSSQRSDAFWILAGGVLE